MRDGSKAVWNFSENPSVLEAPPDPNDNDIMILTPKNAFVDPQQKVPYLILVCLERSSAPFTGDDILFAVRKAGHEDFYRCGKKWETYRQDWPCRRTS